MVAYKLKETLRNVIQITRDLIIRWIIVVNKRNFIIKLNITIENWSIKWINLNIH